VGWSKRFLDHIAGSIGYKPLLYINLALAKAHDWSPVINSDYGLWIAEWNGVDGTSDTPWPNVAMHQYADNGQIPGISGNVDLDVFYGDAGVFNQYCYQPTQVEQPTPAPHPEPAPEPVPTPEPTPEPVTNPEPVITVTPVPTDPKPLVPVADPTPHPKVIAAAVSGAIVSFVLWGLKHFGISLAPEQAAILVTIVSAFFGYTTSSN
jgi:hypothetical protein